MKRDVMLSVAGVLLLLSSIFFLADITQPSALTLLYNEDVALTFEGAMAISEEIDRIADQLEAPAGPPETSDLFALSAEIVPYFYYDGIVEGKEKFPFLAHTFLAGQRNFHVAGSYSLLNGSIVINWRFINPYSAWYRRPNAYATLVHELGHAQGINLVVQDDQGRFKIHDDTEPANQLATLEVLAALSRSNTAWAYPAFLRELQGFADDFAFSCALRENRMDEYRAYIGRIGNNGVFSEAAFERAMDYWKDDMDTLKYILRAYGERPYVLLVGALGQKTLLTQQLDPVPNWWHRIWMNDTGWIIDNMERLSGDYPALLAKAEERLEE